MKYGRDKGLEARGVTTEICTKPALQLAQILLTLTLKPNQLAILHLEATSKYGREEVAPNLRLNSFPFSRLCREREYSEGLAAMPRSGKRRSGPQIGQI